MEKSKKEIIEIAHSLDGTEMIYHFLPELLADFNELGAFTDEILEVLKTNNLNLAGAEVLDVAYGKGAVGILLAQEFGCKVTGVDLMSSFIEDAMNTAQRRRVENLCRFVCSDVRKFDAGPFDLVIVASAGPIWGNWKKSAAALRGFVKEEGFLLIDDCVLKEDKFVYRDYPSRDRFINDITSSGYRLLAEKFVDDQKMIDLNNR
ncbi:MAG: class I SAM-dependent methyltransferase, partial [Bacteroidota bacterium]